MTTVSAARAGRTTVVACDGWLRSVKGHVIVFTGKVLVDDIWRSQADCGGLVEERGGRWVGKPSASVTLVVHGDLAGKTVQDPRRGYSEKLVHAQKQRSYGSHVCVIDAAGFSDLLLDRPARCRRLRVVAGRGPVPQPVPGDRVLAEPYDLAGKPPSMPPTRRSLTIDLSAIERATAAHEATVRALAEHLERSGATPQLADRRGPQFDLGWRARRRLHIAEVKTLTGADETQQVRLGFGQLLDYQAELQARGHISRPVLVLQRKPFQVDRWQRLAARAGTTLTWGPGFPGL